MPPPDAAPPRASFGALVITQAIALVGCVLVPVLVTFVVPRTTIELRRLDGGVEAVVTRHVLLVVPISIRSIAPVTAVASRVREDEFKARLDAEERRKGRAHFRAGDGSILLTGGGGTAQIQSTPADAPRDVERIEAFLADSSPGPVVVTATAGWLFTYLLGGIMTALAALYAVGATLAVLSWLVRGFRPGRNRTLSDPPR